MSRGIRKTGIFIAVMLTVVVLTGCQIAKKDESGQAKEELYGAYAVVGDRIPAVSYTHLTLPTKA